MAIHIEEQQRLQKGIAKEIDEGGIALMFDTWQKYQYQYPIKSTVRELLCNGIDSVAEKNMARDILSGKARKEEYFVDMEGPLYKDSRWTPEYYDLKYLSGDDNVYMTYIIGEGAQKDRVEIRDNGVGLGGKRLEGYFKLAFSTKRLSKLPLGKFGLGAKAPLSIGIDFYTVESRYNGQLYRFSVYSQTYYSLVPEVDLESSRRNEYVLFKEGTPDEFKVYWEPTSLPNGVTIILEAKKHHKQQYLEAVKSQMLYFSNIRLRTLENKQMQDVAYKASILYEDELIVMSDNNYFSKPHLLLNKVNYGYIDWSELELQELSGNIGVKVAPEDVEVNPSRESVLWTDKTKNKVLTRFKEVVGIAENLIQEELKQTDLAKWLKTCFSISGRYSERGGILGRLAQIVDLTQVKPKFLPYPKLHFSQMDPLPGIFTRRVVWEELKIKGETKKKVMRSLNFSWSSMIERPLILLAKEDRASNRKDKYLNTLYSSGFLALLEPPQDEEDLDALPEYLQEWYSRQEGTRIHWKEVWDLLVKSKDVLWYSKIEVPESFTGTEEEEDVEDTKGDQKEEERQKVIQIAAAERRKLEGKVLIHTPKANFRGFDSITQTNFYYQFQKMEVPIRDINDLDAEEIYYGNEEDSELMHFVAALTRDPHPENKLGSPRRGYADDSEKWIKSKYFRLNEGRFMGYGMFAFDAFYCQHFADAKVMLLKVSKQNTRYVRDFRHIQEFFIQIKNRTITMSNTLVQWNTARLVKERLKEAEFLYNFKTFHPGYAEIYEVLSSYVLNNYRYIDPTGNNTYGMKGNTYQDLLVHLENVRKFQEFVAHQAATPEDIALLAQDLFGNRELRDGMAVDPAIMRLLEEMLEFAHAVGPMLNYIPVLTDNRVPIPEELEVEVRQFLDQKGLLNYYTSLEIEREASEITHLSAGEVEELEEPTSTLVEAE